MFIRMPIFAIAGVLLLASTTNATTSIHMRRPLGENPSIRAMITNTATTITVRTRVPYRLSELQGAQVRETSAGETLHFRAGSDGVDLEPGVGSTKGFVIESPNSDALAEIFGWSPSPEPRIYSGKIEVRFTGKNRLTVINELPLEEYLRGVVPSEIGGNTPHQAQCAQAIAARSEAVLALASGKYNGPGYDICSTVQCQVFSGRTVSTAAADAAISATRGLILAFDGKPVSAFYAAHCGGHSEDIRNVWADRNQGNSVYSTSAGYDGVKLNLDLTREADFRKYLEMDREVYCNPARYEMPAFAARNFSWTRNFTPEEVARATRGKDIGTVTEMRPLKRGVSGRIVDLELVGDRGTHVVKGQMVIRTSFTPPLRSSAFIVDKETSTGGTLFTLRGTGSGHGVGMCQTGAMGMASAGKNFEEILKQYYPAAKIEQLY